MEEKVLASIVSINTLKQLDGKYEYPSAVLHGYGLQATINCSASVEAVNVLLKNR